MPTRNDVGGPKVKSRADGCDKVELDSQRWGTEPALPERRTRPAGLQSVVALPSADIVLKRLVDPTDVTHSSLIAI